MLILMNLTHVVSLMNPTSNYEFANICMSVERILSSCYLVDCRAIQGYAPIPYVPPNVETLIHHEIRKVLPLIKELRDVGKTIYIDLTIQGTLTLSTEKSINDYTVYTPKIPSF